jgi:hypothetical protein
MTVSVFLAEKSGINLGAAHKEKGNNQPEEVRKTHELSFVSGRNELFHRR